MLWEARGPRALLLGCRASRSHHPAQVPTRVPTASAETPGAPMSVLRRGSITPTPLQSPGLHHRPWRQGSKGSFVNRCGLEQGCCLGGRGHRGKLWQAGVGGWSQHEAPRPLS